MGYFNYHATAKALIKAGKLKKFYFLETYHGISPALVLEFNDLKHPVMPIRKHKFSEYLEIIEEQNENKKNKKN